MASERARIYFSTSIQVRQYLEALAAQGLYGRTWHEAAERLLCESITRRIEQQLVDDLSARLTEESEQTHGK